MKHLVDRPRPIGPQPAAARVFSPDTRPGTAVLCVAVLLVVQARSRRPVQPLLVAVAVGVVPAMVVAVAVSRVLLGVHYPTDVAGGAALGVATALGLVPPAGPHRDRRQPDRARDTPSR